MDNVRNQVKLCVNGREMIRINGVYMYVINRNGQVGAILGFHPMVIVMYEDREDREAVKGYLRVDRWIYPLARSFSPIYIWDADKMIMPEPFSSLNEPIYIVIRLPFAMSRFQKDTLFNLLDISAHLRGKFSHPTIEEIKRRDKLFELTNLTRCDNMKLDQAEKNNNQPETNNQVGLNNPQVSHQLLAPENSKTRLSVCFSGSREVKAVSPAIFLQTLQRKRENSSKRLSRGLTKDIRPVQREYFGPLSPTDNPESKVDWPGGWPKLQLLPHVRGNLIRLYVLGPRDAQHIQISTIMEWLPISRIILSAVNLVFREQVKLRKEKELQGVPPSFEGRRLRLLGGWGAAKSLNEFGPSKPSEANASGPYMDLTKVDPAYSTIFHSATTIQNLEAASVVFDYALDRCKLQLISCFTDEISFDKIHSDIYLGPLIPRELIVRYRKRSSTFINLMTLSETVESDLIYEKHKCYFERLHEDCEHHYPKLRPRNIVLDPQYSYARKPPAYQLLNYMNEL